MARDGSASPRRRPSASGASPPQTAASRRPQTASTVAARPTTAGLQAAKAKGRDESPYSPRHKLSLSRESLNRPQTAGEAFALHSSAWGMKPMPPGSARSRSSDSKIYSGRDREALVIELVELRRIVAEQNKQMKRSKLLAAAAEHENRKLERDILDLELKGITDALVDCDSPFLREKLQELKNRISSLQTACRLQNEELCLLRRDLRGTHTKELEMERDVFYEEATALQRDMRKLQAIHTKVNSENKELVQARERNAQLEEGNQSLLTGIGEVQGNIEKVNQGLLSCRFKTSEASIAIRRYAKQIRDLQRFSSNTESLIQKNKDAKYRCQLRLPVLLKKLEKSKKELAIALKEKERARVNKVKKLVQEQRKSLTAIQRSTQSPPKSAPLPSRQAAESSSSKPASPRVTTAPAKPANSKVTTTMMTEHSGKPKKD